MEKQNTVRYNAKVMEGISLGAHLLTLLYVVGVMLIADYSGFRWFSGAAPTLSLRSVQRLHTLMWVGLLLMITTGALVFWPYHAELLRRQVFWIKMGFVGTLFFNAFFIGRLMHIATVRTFVSLTRNEKMLFIVSALLSLSAWIGAAASAFFILP